MPSLGSSPSWAGVPQALWKKTFLVGLVKNINNATTHL